MVIYRWLLPIAAVASWGKSPSLAYIIDTSISTGDGAMTIYEDIWGICMMAYEYALSLTSSKFVGLETDSPRQNGCERLFARLNP